MINKLILFLAALVFLVSFAFTVASKSTSTLQFEVHQTGAAGGTTMAAGGLSIGILGTGRMGTHLTATWGASNQVVTLGSRDKSKAEGIVEALVAGRGYSGSGGERVPPFAKDDWKIKGGSLEEACEADILVLVTPFPTTAGLLDSLRASIIGRGKVIIDMTNPWYSGSGLPKADHKAQ